MKSIVSSWMDDTFMPILTSDTLFPLLNKKRYDSELPYQRPDLIEVMEIEIDLTTSTNVHTSFYKSVGKSWIVEEMT